MTNQTPFSLLDIKTETIATRFRLGSSGRNKQNKMLPANPNRVALTVGGVSSSSVYVTPFQTVPLVFYGPFRVSNLYTLSLSLADDGDLVTFPMWLFTTLNATSVYVYETVRIDK